MLVGLQLHRSYFLKALEGPDTFNALNRCVGSIYATFQSACQLIQCLEYVFDQEPQVTSRFPYLWSNTLAAAARLNFIPLIHMLIQALAGILMYYHGPTLYLSSGNDVHNTRR